MQENKMERTVVVGEARTSSLTRICGAGGMAKQHAAEWPEQPAGGVFSVTR
jgi:hypothetical protein